MRGLRTDHCLVPGEQQPEPEHVRAAAVQHQVHLAVPAGEPLQLANGSCGPRVCAVGDRVPGVRLDDGAHDGWMHSRVVVAAKAFSHACELISSALSSLNRLFEQRQAAGAPDSCPPPEASTIRSVLEVPAQRSQYSLLSAGVTMPE